MNLGEMEQGLALIVRDSSLEPHFPRMINDAILELAADFDLPALKLLTPHSFPVTTANWIYELPADHQKNLFRCADGEWRPVRICRTMDDLDNLDIDHDETRERVTHVAVADTGLVNSLGVYPLANDTLHLWYYRKPMYLEDPDDVPDCLPAAFHERVIIPKVIIKNYQLLQDQVENFDPKPLQYWEAKLKEGLHGSSSGPIGLINYLSKAKGGPRRHGGRDPLP